MIRLVAAISENSLYWYLWGLAILFELDFPLLQMLTGFDSVGLITPLLEQIVFILCWGISWIAE